MPDGGGSGEGHPGCPPFRADEDYFQGVESRFAQLRGKPLLLSTRDVALVDEWWRLGIPLPIVLEAVESVFRRRGEDEATQRPVLSLSYCRHAVAEAFEDWKESRLGSGGEGAATPGAEPPPEPQAAAARLDTWVAALRSRAGAPARDAAQALAALAAQLRGATPPSLAEAEAQLTELEDRLVADLLAALPNGERAALEERVEADLAPLRPRLTERAYHASREGQLREALRAREDLPRLTLYLL